MGFVDGFGDAVVRRLAGYAEVEMLKQLDNKQQLLKRFLDLLISFGFTASEV
jgi:hypothetical protein